MPSICQELIFKFSKKSIICAAGAVRDHTLRPFTTAVGRPEQSYNDAPNNSQNSHSSHNSQNSRTGVVQLYLRAAVVIKQFFMAALYSWEWLLGAQVLLKKVLPAAHFFFAASLPGEGYRRFFLNGDVNSATR